MSVLNSKRSLSKKKFIRLSKMPRAKRGYAWSDILVRKPGCIPGLVTVHDIAFSLDGVVYTKTITKTGDEMYARYSVDPTKMIFDKLAFQESYLTLWKWSAFACELLF